jgi:glycosyltransferase involved in cell wall biosynthesis
MRIVIAGPIATESIVHLLDDGTGNLPIGYKGAPLLSTLIRSMIDRGHSVIGITTSSDLPASGKPVVANGNSFKMNYCPARTRAFRFSDGHWGRGMDFFRLERRALCKVMRHEKPDIVHAHWIYEFGLAAIESGLPHLVTCHDAPQVVLRHMPDLYRLVRYFMGRKCLSKALALTAVSPYLKEKVERYTKIPITVIPNPIPQMLIESPHSPSGYDPAAPRIAMVINGWGRRKNPKPAMRAFQLIHKKIPGAKLYLYGTDFGPGEVAQAWAQKHGLSDGMIFVGARPHDFLLADLSAANILLHPSLEETFGMSVVEAMALGIPVVGGDRSGAVPWVLGKGSGGILTDVRSPPAICYSVLKILSDSGQYQNISRKANEMIKNLCTPLSVVKQYEHQYELIREHQ